MLLLEKILWLLSGKHTKTFGPFQFINFCIFGCSLSQFCFSMIYQQFKKSRSGSWMLGAIEKEKSAKNFSVAPSTQKGSKKDQQRRPRSTSSTKISICRCARLMEFFYSNNFLLPMGSIFYCLMARNFSLSQKLLGEDGEQRCLQIMGRNLSIRISWQLSFCSQTTREKAKVFVVDLSL